MSHFSCSFLKVNKLLQCFHPLNPRQVFGHSGIIKTLGHWKTWDCKPSFQFKEVTPVAHLWTLEGFEDVKNLLMITIVVELICHFLLGCMDWISFMWPNMWSTREAWDLCTSGSAKQCPAFPPPAMAVSSFSNNGPQPEHPPGCGASQKAGTWFQGRFVIPIVQDVQEYITECFPMVSMDSGPVDSNSPIAQWMTMPCFRHCLRAACLGLIMVTACFPQDYTPKSPKTNSRGLEVYMVYHMLIHFENHVEQTQQFCTILLDTPFVGLAKVTSSSHRKTRKEPGCGSDPVADLETKGLLDEKTELRLQHLSKWLSYRNPIEICIRKLSTVEYLVSLNGGVRDTVKFQLQTQQSVFCLGFLLGGPPPVSTQVGPCASHGQLPERCCGTGQPMPTAPRNPTW